MPVPALPDQQITRLCTSEVLKFRYGLPAPQRADTLPRQPEIYWALTIWLQRPDRYATRAEIHRPTTSQHTPWMALCAYCLQKHTIERGNHRHTHTHAMHMDKQCACAAVRANTEIERNAYEFHLEKCMPLSSLNELTFGNGNEQHYVSLWYGSWCASLYQWQVWERDLFVCFMFLYILHTSSEVLLMVMFIHCLSCRIVAATQHHSLAQFTEQNSNTCIAYNHYSCGTKQYSSYATLFVWFIWKF